MFLQKEIKTSQLAQQYKMYTFQIRSRAVKTHRNRFVQSKDLIVRSGSVFITTDCIVTVTDAHEHMGMW